MPFSGRAEAFCLSVSHAVSSGISFLGVPRSDLVFIAQLHATKGLAQLFLEAVDLASESGNALYTPRVCRTVAFLGDVSAPGFTSPKGANSPLRAGDGSE